MDASSQSKPVKVLFVCMGNICRSPTAEGVFRALVTGEGLADHYEIDSAGTHGYHVGEPPDQRSQQAAAQRGYDLSGQRARQVCAEDFGYYDFILAMDQRNLALLQAQCPKGYQGKLKLFLEFARGVDEWDVPDPYYGGGAGFTRVLDLCESAAKGLLAATRNTSGP